jgi:hypothetical protein
MKKPPLTCHKKARAPGSESLCVLLCSHAQAGICLLNLDSKCSKSSWNAISEHGKERVSAQVTCTQDRRWTELGGTAGPWGEHWPYMERDAQLRLCQSSQGTLYFKEALTQKWCLSSELFKTCLFTCYLR